MQDLRSKGITIYEGKDFSLIRDHYILSNGVEVEIEMIRHPGAAAIVASTASGEIILIKQYRHALSKEIWEIPSGTICPGETPLECAKREFGEETGFAASVWKRLGVITPAPGYSDDRIHLFSAANLVSGRQYLEKDEILEVHKFPLKEVLGMIYKGIIQDAKTISGIFAANPGCA